MAEFTSVSATATQIYVAPPSGIPNVTIFNNSNALVYLGGSAVTAVTGVALAPNGNIQFANATTAIWAVSGPGVLGTASTLSANAAVGATAATITATSGFGTASTIIIGSGNAAETVTLATIASTAVTFTTGTRFAHLSGEAASLVSAPQTASVIVHRGTV